MGNLDAVNVTKYPSSGTYSYIDDGGEQTVIELTDGSYKMLGGIWLDLSNMTQNSTIKCYYKIDGTNYRQLNVGGTVQNYAFTVADTIDGVYLDLHIGISYDFKVTYEEGGDEGAARDIPYQIVYF